MEVIHDIREAQVLGDHVVLTVGSFDGVHLGHRRVLEKVVQTARQRGGTAAVMTFKPHPRRFFSPGHAPNLLTTDAQKLAQLEGTGVDTVCFLPFDAEAAGMAPRTFVDDIARARCNAEVMVVGHDFRFGEKASGDRDLLGRLSGEARLEVVDVPPLFVDGERVSSTLIREMLLQGDLGKARRLLGRDYAILAEVCKGRGIGARLGFPTANMKPGDVVIPAQGVYAATARCDGQECRAAVNIGIAPTVRHEDSIVEAHLLDFHESLLGQTVEVVLHERIRPERKFDSMEELSKQIQADVDWVRRYFREGVSGGG